KQAKEELKNKNYEVSKSLFEKARDIYLQLNYMGKVNVIEKQLAQIKRVIEYEQRSKKEPVAEIENMIGKVQERKEHIVKPELSKIQDTQENISQDDKKLEY
ncbi:unnamed protein product, partial [marine sediment metagenome]